MSVSDPLLSPFSGSMDGMSRSTAEADMTPAQREQWDAALAKIEQMNADREAAEAARVAAITPHVRRTPKKRPGRMSGPRYFNLMREMDVRRDEYADYRPTTYCGAPLTTEDWSRRSAIATKNAHLVAEAGVCPECLRLARETE